MTLTSIKGLVQEYTGAGDQDNITIQLQPGKSLADSQSEIFIMVENDILKYITIEVIDLVKYVYYQYPLIEGDDIPKEYFTDMNDKQRLDYLLTALDTTEPIDCEEIDYERFDI